MNECIVCKRPLVEGEQVVPIIKMPAPGVSMTWQDFMHLRHVAAPPRQLDPTPFVGVDGRYAKKSDVGLGKARPVFSPRSQYSQNREDYA